MAAQRSQVPAVLHAFLSLSMREGLRVTLLELAKFYGNSPGPWLDRIEKEVIDGLKASSAEGIDIKTEANALTGALAVIEQFFDDIRSELRDATPKQEH